MCASLTHSPEAASLGDAGCVSNDTVSLLNHEGTPKGTYSLLKQRRIISNRRVLSIPPPDKSGGFLGS